MSTAGPNLRPHPGPVPDDVEPSAIAGHKSGALRAAVFGVQDGIVSNLALIMAVAGAGLEPGAVIVAGVAGLLAGAFSMAAGEYHSMRVQREIYERLIHLEAHELAMDPEGERNELVRILERRGIPRDAAVTAAAAMMSDPDQALEVHAREELGLDPEALGSPWGAGASSLATFASGAFIPLVPFLFAGGAVAAWVSVGLSLVALFAVGAWLATFTGRLWWLAGVRMLGIGGGAALVTYAVGRGLGVAVS
jgi:VIT1/CCC1 family predicted Fe2+/Mn2+ transporter